ncbi:MAG: FkbM family methyltransferase [Nitrososphaeria archaeon]
MHAFQNPLTILGNYIIIKIGINKNMIVRIRGTSTKFIVSGYDIQNAIELAYALYSCKNSYTIEGSKLIINIGELSACFNIFELLKCRNYIKLWALGSLKKIGAIVNFLGPETLFISLDGYNWVTRKNVPWDILCGPLLPYIHEPYVYHNWFTKYIRNIHTFIDVGSYIGGYSIRASKMGVKNVIAIEPDQENFNILLKNIELNKCKVGIQVFNIAAGEKEQFINLYSPEKDNLGMINVIGKGVRKGCIKCYPLDKILKVEGPIMVKIDVEGYEEAVLKGMAKILPKVNILFMEIQGNPSSFNRFLAKKGFRLVDYHFKNYLFIRSA